MVLKQGGGKQHDKERTILHCDCNGFYASVECLCHPEYRAVPMAVCGDPESRRGIILAKNELAKGLWRSDSRDHLAGPKEMPGSGAGPPPSRFICGIFSMDQRYLPAVHRAVEPFSSDESWLDVTAPGLCFGGGRQIADELRAVVRRGNGITISVGVSF